MGNKEYLVSGAELMCTSGSKKGRLKVPAGHGYTSGGKNKANCEDCREPDNIPYFGMCSKNKTTHKCEGYMKLADKWQSMSVSLKSAEKVGGADAINMKSVLFCNKGGLIMPVTSGQGYEKGVDLREFLKKFQKIMPWTLGKSLICHILGRDPVNLNTGNYIYEKRGLVIPGITELSFCLMYNSMSADRERGCLGVGWSHNYGTHIRQETGGLCYLCLDDGRNVPYRRTIGDIYMPVFGDKGILKKEKDGFLYRTSDGGEYVFDGRGLLLTKKDRNGNMDSFFHNKEGQLIKVSGANGGELFYTYNREGNLICVNDHTGREIRLWYRYGKLWKYVNESGHAYIYEYNENGRLESIVTPRGIRGVYNEYDAANRVIKQILPDGSVAEMRYDDENMRSYVKNPDGSIVIHEMDERFRNVKTIYEDGEEIFGYNDSNQRTFYIDKNGNKTKYRYDERGNLTGITNALGQVTEYTYDRGNRLLTMSAEGKKFCRNTYDEKGRLVKSTDAIGRSREIIYNENGQPKRILQPDGSSMSIEYDDRGNITGVIDSLGSTTQFTYDRLNRLTSFTDAEKNTVQYAYDCENHMIEVTSQEGNTRTYIYSESGKITNIRDFDGKQFMIEYDGMNHPCKLIDKEGKITLRRYDLMGNLKEEILPSGAVISRFYDRNGRPVREEIRAGSGDEVSTVNMYSYDPVGNLEQISVGNGKEVLSELSYIYDALNRVVQVVDSVGGKTLFDYNAAGHVKGITDPAGNVKTFTYNDVGEMVEATDIYGNTIKYTYNLLGQVLSITDGIGREIRYQYQPGGLMERIVYPDGREVGFTYDSLGRVKSKTDGNGYGLFYHYDSMGRILKVISNTGQEKNFVYDLAGNIVSSENANRMTTHYEYSSGGNLTAVTDALGNRTEYTYDATGNLTSICQMGRYGEENREIYYDRNPLGQVECIRDILGYEEHFQYDALGRVLRKLDKEGYQTEYTYTPDGKIKGITYGDGTQVEMEYTSLRQLALVRDWLGETRITRNQQGKPVQVVNHEGKCVEYEWGSMGEKRGIIYPDGRTVRYGYDGLLRLNELVREEAGKDNLRITYRYDKEGRLSEKRMPGDISTCWKYDSHGLLEELIHKDGKGILDRYRYGYDAMGNKVWVEKTRRGLAAESGNYIYRYDALNRLEGVEKDGKTLRGYAYDSFGNRKEMVDYSTDKKTIYMYNALNQMISEEVLEQNAMSAAGNAVEPLSATSARKAYTYDLRGNMTAEYRGNEILFGYDYNAMNRLERAWNWNGQEVGYRYNGIGYRVGKSSGNGEENYLLDLTRPYHNLLEVQSGEKTQRFYWDTNTAAMEEDEKLPKFYLSDELGSPGRVLYETGKGDVYGYDEFGNDLNCFEMKEDSIHYTKQGKGQPFGYTGYCYDDVSGTYYAQMREYRPEKGRFTAEDVIRGNGSMPNTLNRYSYCWGNPENFIDNDGKFPVALVVVIGAAAFLCGCGSQDEQEPVVQIIEPIKAVDPPIKKDKATSPNSSLKTEMMPEQVSVPDPEGQLISNLDDYNVVQRTELIELLETMESFQPKAYYATKNEIYKTIGIGHLCDDPTGADAKYLVEGYVMTYKDAEDLLIQDLNEKMPEEMLNELFNKGVSLYDYQIDALLSLSYTLASFTPTSSNDFFNYLSEGNYTEEETLNNWLTYTTQGGVVLPGLVKRRVAEAMIFSGLGYPKVKDGDFCGDGDLKQLLFDYASQFNLNSNVSGRICKCLD